MSSTTNNTTKPKHPWRWFIGLYAASVCGYAAIHGLSRLTLHWLKFIG